MGKEDVPKEIQYPQEHVHDLDGLKLTSFEQGTNGLLYQQVLVEMPQLTEEEQALLPLYSKCFGELGAGDLDYRDIQQTLSEHSGGVSAFYSFKYLPNREELRGHFVVSAKALNRKAEVLNELLKTIFENTRFDEVDRLKDMVAQARLGKEQSVTSNGHSLAMLAASSRMSPTSLIFTDIGWAGLNSEYS